MDIIVNRIKSLCKEFRIPIAQLESELGFSANSINKWKTSSPSIDKLIKVSRYFNVSIDYLTGVSELRTVNANLPGDIVTIQRARENMSDKDRERMMKMIRVCFDYAFDDNQTFELEDLIEAE